MKRHEVTTVLIHFTEENKQRVQYTYNRKCNVRRVRVTSIEAEKQ
jgi:hypothetical protein